MGVLGAPRALRGNRRGDSAAPRVFSSSRRAPGRLQRRLSRKIPPRASGSAAKITFLSPFTFPQAPGGRWGAGVQPQGVMPQGGTRLAQPRRGNRGPHRGAAVNLGLPQSLGDAECLLSALPLAPPLPCVAFPPKSLILVPWRVDGCCCPLRWGVTSQLEPCRGSSSRDAADGPQT